MDGEEAIGHDYEEKTVGRTCESYGYTVHTCKNCADRYVTDYVKPAGHDYEKTVVKAEEGKVGYTKYTCKECDYNYISDFVTSGDDGYIEENPDTPTEPEQPDKPTEPDKPENPDQPENPDKPENPDEHTHVYVFDAVVREQEKTMTVSYVCECGDNRTEFVKVEFTSVDDGSGVVLIPGENGELDFAVLEGKYIVTVTNDNGEELMVYEVNLAKNEPKPVEPEQPDKPTEPEQPETPDKPDDKPNEDKPSEPEKPDTPSDSETDKPSDTEKEEKKTPPPLLYDLTELQRECNRKFGFSAKKTLDIAQSLYEKRKMITYPRTDSRYLSEDMKGKVKSTIHRLQALEEYAPYAEPLMQEIRFTKRIIDNAKVTDHHAIIPTDGKLRPESLSEDERKVFSLVAARFLAVFYPYYRYEVTKVYAEAEQERFLSKGTVVLEEGWQAVEKALVPTATKKKKAKNEEEQKLPPLQEGEVRAIRSMELLRKKTKPPAPYTESSLLSAMENAGRFVEDEALREQMKDSGLGTPATRAAIIERLLTVGYLTRKGKTLLPTEKGRKLIEVVPQEMRSPQTTGKWEKGLSSIAKGKMTEERFMASIRRYVQFLIQDAASGRRADVIFPEEQVRGKRRKTNAFGKCPFCGRDILENSKSFYCAGWKSGCKFSLWKDSLKPYGLELDGGMVKLLLKKNKSERVAVTLPQTGEKGTAVLILNKDKGGQIELMDFNRENA